MQDVASDAVAQVQTSEISLFWRMLVSRSKWVNKGMCAHIVRRSAFPLADSPGAAYMRPTS
ncbi:hypothetical protein GCM10011393_22370 [Sphingopyxis bauzanensis]|nr:hypothetical protein GCM10011393_22370 [Sphingopyxis bauzanensis]